MWQGAEVAVEAGHHQWVGQVLVLLSGQRHRRAAVGTANALQQQRGQKQLSQRVARTPARRQLYMQLTHTPLAHSTTLQQQERRDDDHDKISRYDDERSVKEIVRCG